MVTSHGPDVFIPELIDLYNRGLFPFGGLATGYDLDQINQAVSDAECGATIKPVIRMPHRDRLI